MPGHTRFCSIALAGWMLVSPGLAIAQSEPPAVDPPHSDPPGRVGRLARITGTVSLRTADQTDWQPASLNYPATSGQTYWTGPGARADIEIAGTKLVLDQSSQLELETLDDHRLTGSLVQGNLAVTLRQMEPGDNVTLRTPRGTVTLATDGRYAIATGDPGRPGTVTVIEGQAQIVGPGISLAVGPHQTATITGQEILQASVGPQATDAFIVANTAPPPPLPTGQFALPEQIQDMTGGAILADTGSWEAVPEYGQVWYPPVAASWVPYRHGHWAHVLPWGWTWVDDAPWGFAPFHYGRWLQVGPRWGWIPGAWEGRHHRPIYAPALVAFVGFGAGVALGARHTSPVGWVPLGPRERYRPSYGASPGYANRVNFGHNQAVTNNSYVNRHSTTMVPASVMGNAQPVARNPGFVSPPTLGSARPTANRQPAAPGPVASNRPGFIMPNSAAPAPTARPNFTGAAGSLPRVERPSAPQPQRQFAPPTPQRGFPTIQPPQYQRPAPTPYQQAIPHYNAPQQQQHYAAPQQHAAPAQQQSAPSRSCSPGQKHC